MISQEDVSPEPPAVSTLPLEALRRAYARRKFARVDGPNSET
jgi:hypothetical protein